MSSIYWGSTDPFVMVMGIVTVYMGAGFIVYCAIKILKALNDKDE